MKKQQIDLGSMNVADLMKLRNKKVNQVAQLKASVDSRRMNVANMMQMNKDLQNIRDKFFASTPLHEINNIMYPYQYQSALVEIPNDDVGVSKITVSAEASFIVTRMQRVIFETTGGNIAFIDPDDPTVNGDVFNLKYEINDLSSERTFMDRPVSLASLGSAQNPMRLNDPFLLESNQSLEVRFYNENVARSYVCSILFSGYRLRIDDMNHLLQKVTL